MITMNTGVDTGYNTVPRDPDRLDLPLLLQVCSALSYGHHVPSHPS